MNRFRRLAPAFAVLFVSLAGGLSAQTGMSRNTLPEQVGIGRDTRPVRLLRSWYDSIKTRRGEIQRRVDVVYDYGQAAAFERASTLDGRLMWSRRIRVNPPQPSPEEIAEAKEIVRANPELQKVMARFNAELEGGFLTEEKAGMACGPGTRCVLIQLVAPRHAGLIRWTAVDLVKQRIAYLTFVPSDHGAVK